MSIETQAVESRTRRPIWMILVLLFSLLLPLNVYSEDVNEDMIKAAYMGNTATVKSCIEKGANVNAKMGDSGLTALMLAAGGGHTEMVEVLLANGAQVNVKSDLGDTALSRTTDNGHNETIRILKDAEAKE
jgi:ankyrin repeat protein